MSLFEVENLTYYYPETEHPALYNVNIAVEEGEFLLIVGGSGSGKSSLARALTGLIPDFYGGRIGGKVCFKKRDIRSICRLDLAREIGIVFQDPEKQLVMTGVESEMAFGLENMGLPQTEMFRRVAEVMSFLGLTSLKAEFTATLSGGQKQKLALGSVLAMQPNTLILDEPTSQLDPAAAEEFFNLIKRLNEEINLTIVLVEQRLDRCFHLADRVVVMENGEIIRDGIPDEIAEWQVKNGLPFVPPVAAFFSRTGSPVVPLTVKEGRVMLKKKLQDSDKGLAFALDQHKKALLSSGGKPVVEVKSLWFAYPNGREALRGINFSANTGDFLAVLGENAAGKTTLLKHLVGLLKPNRGKVTIMGCDTRQATPQQLARTVGYLSQNPNDYLFQDTVAEELHFTLTNLGLPDEGRVDRLLEKLDLARHQLTNPRDLSSGERQRAALASVMVASPQLLVLDEPTRGLDYGLKAGLGNLLHEIAKDGTTVIVVTHDVEFAAEYACRVMMLFDGRVAYDGLMRTALGNSMFYAPQISRLFRGFDNGVLTLREALERMRLSQC